MLSSKPAFYSFSTLECWWRSSLFLYLNSIFLSDKRLGELLSIS